MRKIWKDKLGKNKNVKFRICLNLQTSLKVFIFNKRDV